MLKSNALQILQIVTSIKRQVKYTNNLMTLNKYCNMNYEFFLPKYVQNCKQNTIYYVKNLT